jgi:hypothetical protein
MLVRSKKKRKCRCDKLKGYAIPDYKDIVSLVRGAVPETPPIAIWALPSNTAGVVSGIPDWTKKSDNDLFSCLRLHFLPLSAKND